MPANREVTEVEAFSGVYVDFVNPRPDQIRLEDIATGLAKICRFAGQTTKFYSVAEHSVYVADLVPDHLKLTALFHDGHEAYTGDVSAPLKRTLEFAAPGVLKGIQHRLDEAIAEALYLDLERMHDPAVKMADDYAMYREAATLKYSHGIGKHWGNDQAYVPLVGVGWSPDKAERMFLEAYERYSSAL